MKKANMSAPSSPLNPAPTERMLVATDLTDLGRILPAAIAYASRYGAALDLLHVLPDTALLNRICTADTPCQSHRDETAIAILEEAVERARAAGVSCRYRTRNGPVALTIRQAVQESLPDRIIIGTHNTRKFQQSLLGSVTEEILREINIPILTVGFDPFARNIQPARTARVLFATALDLSSRAFTQTALDYAAAQRAELTMLHIIPVIASAHPFAARVRSYAESMFEELVANAAEHQQHLSCQIAEGETVEAILRIAAQGGYDMILLNVASGASFRKDVVPGTAYRVICGAACPVMVLKHLPYPDRARPLAL